MVLWDIIFTVSVIKYFKSALHSNLDIFIKTNSQSCSSKIFKRDISPAASMVLGVHLIFFTDILPWMLITEKSQNMSDWSVDWQ